jgi:hypothetical protein
MKFKLSDSKGTHSPLKLNLLNQTLESHFDKDKNSSTNHDSHSVTSVNMNTARTRKIYFKFVVNNKEFVVKQELDFGKFENDNSILKFVRENNKNGGHYYSNFYGTKDPRTTPCVTGYDGHEYNNYILELHTHNPHLNSATRIVNNNFEILIIIHEIEVRKYNSLYRVDTLSGRFVIKLVIPLEEFKDHFHYDHASTATQYLTAIGNINIQPKYACLLKFGFNDKLVMQIIYPNNQVNTETKKNIPNKKCAIYIYSPEYEDSVGIYRPTVGHQTGSVNNSLEGVDNVIMDTGHIVTLSYTRNIIFKVIRPCIDINSNFIKNHNINNTISKIKTDYLLDNTCKVLTHMGPYIILLKTYNISPVDTGVHVYCFNVFEMNESKVHMYTIKTEGYYDTIEQLS